MSPLQQTFVTRGGDAAGRYQESQALEQQVQFELTEALWVTSFEEEFQVVHMPHAHDRID